MCAKKRVLKHDEAVRPIARAISAAFSSDDLNVLVLRCHMIFETLLFRLLSVRLDVEIGDLPALSFGPLVAVALAGERFEELRGPIDDLTRIRNLIAHDIDYANVDEDLASYSETHQRFAARAKSSTADTPILLKFQRVIRGVGGEILSIMRSRREFDVTVAKDLILKLNLDVLRFKADLFRDDLLDMDEHGNVGLTHEQAEALRKWSVDVTTNLRTVNVP
jgi:hypothetical protein